MEIIKYGLLCYDQSYNVGDNTQSLAALQYLPRLDYYVDRDTFKVYNLDGTELDNPKKYTIKVIFNCWFNISYVKKFPPPKYIQPLYISLHWNTDNHKNDTRYNIIKKYITNNKNIEDYKKYFNDQKFEIGCRDFYTCDLLLFNGIKYYFSGCLTLLLKKQDYYKEDIQNDVLVVDSHIDCEQIFNDHVLKNIVKKNIKYLTQGIDKQYNNDIKNEMAKDLLSEIAGSKLIITSRLHSYLPAIAFGIPVIFTHNNLKDIRFNGLIRCYVIGNDGPSNFKELNYDNINWNQMDELFECTSLKNHVKKNEIIIQEFIHSN